MLTLQNPDLTHNTLAMSMAHTLVRIQSQAQAAATPVPDTQPDEATMAQAMAAEAGMP